MTCQVVLNRSFSFTSGPLVAVCHVLRGAGNFEHFLTFGLGAIYHGKQNTYTTNTEVNTDNVRAV